MEFLRCHGSACEWTAHKFTPHIPRPVACLVKDVFGHFQVILALSLVAVTAPCPSGCQDFPRNPAEYVFGRIDRGVRTVTLLQGKPVGVARETVAEAIEDEVRWTIQNNLSSDAQVPNFQDYVYVDGLAAANPTAVNVIR